MDKILTSVDAFGKYQKISMIIIGLISSLNALTIYISVFTVALPQLICKYKEITNQTILLHNATTTTTTTTCDIVANISKYTNKSESPYECEWDTKYYGLTIINEWNLICDHYHLASLTQTIFMIGALLSFFVGYFSDKYGRRKVCLTLAILMCSSIISTQLLQMFNFEISTKYLIYCMLQFLLGFTSYSLYVTSYVLLLELTTPKYSTIVSNNNLYFYILGEMIALLLGYFARDWHIIIWCVGAYSIIIVLIICFYLQESPRYLIARKMYKEALLVLNKIALTNGKEFLIEEFELSNLNDTTNDNESSSNNNNESVLDYLKNPIFNLIKTLLLIYIWISLSMIYYGEG